MDTRDYLNDDFEINRRNPQPESTPTPDNSTATSGSADPAADAPNTTFANGFDGGFNSSFDLIPEVPVEDGPNDEVAVEEITAGTLEGQGEKPEGTTADNEPTEEGPKNLDTETPETENDEPEQPKEDAAAQLLAMVSAQLEGLEAKFDAKIANDEHKNELFNKMYAELADYKRDLYSKLLKPFVTETIRLLEDYERFIDRMQGASLEQIGRFIQDLPDDLNNLLENNGVERYSDDTEKFNPRTQRVVKTIPTDDPALDNVIAERVRQGYVWNGVTLKPETVKIYKYTK